MNDLQNKLVTVQLKKKLKEDAVPTLHLPISVDDTESSSILCDTMLHDHSNQESSIDYHTSAVQTEINFNMETFNTLYSTIHKLEEQLAQSHSTCKDLRNQLQSLYIPSEEEG